MQPPIYTIAMLTFYYSLFNLIFINQVRDHRLHQQENITGYWPARF
jgi:hypothetical protein